MMERTYKAVALSVWAMNAISLLTAYQAELQDEVSVTPSQTQWEEICVVTDLLLRLQRCAVQAVGKDAGLIWLISPTEKRKPF